MKMYRIRLIIDLLLDGLQSCDELVGFEFNERGNLVIVLKEAKDGSLGAEEIELLEYVEDY